MKLLAVLLLGGLAASAQVTLAVGSASGYPGTTVQVPLTISSLQAAAAVQWTLNGATIARMDPGYSTTSGTGPKTLECGVAICIVYGLNSTPIPDGVLAWASVTLPLVVGNYPIGINGIVAASPEALSLPVLGFGGMLLVVSPPAPPPATVDSTPPTVAITYPAKDTTIPRGAVTFRCSASDNVGVIGLQWQWDGVNFGTEVTAAPFSLAVTTSLVNGKGWHTVTAIARDAAANRTTSDSVRVRVQ